MDDLTTSLVCLWLAPRPLEYARTGFPDVYDLWDGKGSPWTGNVERYDCRSMASQLGAEDHLDMFVARESARFLRQYQDQRFFLVASFMKPHTPLFAPAKWAAQYPVEQMELPQVGDISGYPPHIRRRIEHTHNSPTHLQRANQSGYRACLAFVDHCIGHLLDALEQTELLENTIVVYTSDHGEMLGQHGLYGKFCLFDPSVKVPLIVSYPPLLSQNTVSTALIEQLGLYPTLAELTGTGTVDSPTNLPIEGARDETDGRSFCESLHQPDAPGPDAVFSEYALRSGVPQYMVRTPRYKYVHNDGSTHELYDLETDPQECVNQIDEPHLQGTREKLCERLFAWYDPATNPYRG